MNNCDMGWVQLKSSEERALVNRQKTLNEKSVEEARRWKIDKLVSVQHVVKHNVRTTISCYEFRYFLQLRTYNME